MDSTCIACGAIVPEGRQICLACEDSLKNHKVEGVKTKTIGKFTMKQKGGQHGTEEN